MRCNQNGNSSDKFIFPRASEHERGFLQLAASINEGIFQVVVFLLDCFYFLTGSDFVVFGCITVGVNLRVLRQLI